MCLFYFRKYLILILFFCILVLRLIKKSTLYCSRVYFLIYRTKLFISIITLFLLPQFLCSLRLRESLVLFLQKRFL